MALERLIPRIVEKPWGRTDLPDWLSRRCPPDERIGEVWYERASGDPLPLLVKYLFTSEKLSVQVHPDNESARAVGAPSGKDEAWYVTGADEGATIGLGLVHSASKEEIGAAAIDGSIEELIDWRPIEAGDAFYSPSGTIHAIGPGLTLIEIQQSCDLTYRLFDYGRPRELHLEEALAVLDAGSHPERSSPRPLSEGREVLVAGSELVVERWTASGRIEASAERPAWLIPVSQGASAGDIELTPGDVWLAAAEAGLNIVGDGELLIAKQA